MVWADHVEKNKEYEINIPGVSLPFDSYRSDVDPTGFTKWGVQDSDDPNYVLKNIPVFNTSCKSYTEVTNPDPLFQNGQKFLQK